MEQHVIVPITNIIIYTEYSIMPFFANNYPKTDLTNTFSEIKLYFDFKVFGSSE